MCLAVYVPNTIWSFWHQYNIINIAKKIIAPKKENNCHIIANENVLIKMKIKYNCINNYKKQTRDLYTNMSGLIEV